MLLSSTYLAVIASRHFVEGYYKMCRMSAIDVALKYNMNVRALRPALRALTKAGILFSQTGGSEPGFIFTRDPKEIFMSEIVFALEGQMSMHVCKDIFSGVRCGLQNCKNCLIYRAISIPLDELKKNLQTITVYDHYQSIEIEKSKS